MRPLFLILLLILLPALCSRGIAQSYTTGNCADGHLIATRDTAAGKMIIVVYGLRVVRCMEREEQRLALLHASGIEEVDMGCEYYKAYDCYNEVMQSYILHRLGNDFFTRLDAKLDALHPCPK